MSPPYATGGSPPLQKPRQRRARALAAVSRPLRQVDLETLPVEELLRRCAVPIRDEAIESTRELVDWFPRRYPTAKERLACVRRVRARLLGGGVER